MKISKIRIENFKRFNNLEIQFTNNLTKDISDKFLILGDMGQARQQSCRKNISEVFLILTGRAGSMGQTHYRT